MHHSLWRPSLGAVNSSSHLRLATAFTCRSDAAAPLMATPPHTRNDDLRRIATDSHPMQCTDPGEVTCKGAADTAAHAACGAVAVQSSPPECPRCIPPSDWLRPGSGATDSSGRDGGTATALSAVSSARQADGGAAAHAAACREGGAHTGQHPRRAASCAAEQAANATTDLTQHTDAGAATEPPAGRGAAAGGAAQPVQPPSSGASMPAGSAAKRGKRERGGQPKNPRPTHCMAIPLCQASLPSPADFGCSNQTQWSIWPPGPCVFPR